MVVAVIDSGMQLNHGDLAGNLWTNPGEIAGNGIDDDDDGYVDDVHGWDFVGDDNLPNDDFGHGTHVAGTLAAVGNNGIGVVGVAYSSRIMPLRVLDGSGQGYVSDAVRAIDFATRHGVRVSNNSWGYTGAASQVLYDAIQAAGAAGQLVVTAAGNSSADIDAIPEYPAAYDLPNIISVAATTQDDHLAVFSNYGAAGVDVAAPGEHILSTLPGGYGFADGTSMASPHVAGVAALLLAAHPTWTVAPGPRPDPRHRPPDQEPHGQGRDRRHGQRRGRARPDDQPRPGRHDHEARDRRPRCCAASRSRSRRRRSTRSRATSPRRSRGTRAAWARSGRAPRSAGATSSRGRT